jgi:hypothetical protein
MTDTTRDLIKFLKEEVGYSEESSGYSKFGDWYSKNVDKDSTFEKAPWCDMAISWAADKAGLQDYVGQFAYTVAHAKWFKKKDAWTTEPAPGALVFFDYDKSNDLDAIDHVGVVERVEDGKLQTIEANVDGGNLKQKVRETGEDDIVVGYGRPDQVQSQILAKSGKQHGTDGTTEGTKALTGAGAAGYTPPGGAPMGEPAQALLSGLLVLLVAIVYVTGALAKMRLPAATNQVSGAITAMTATATATATAAMSVLTTAKDGTRERMSDLASTVRTRIRALPAPYRPRGRGRHHRR